jgi:hypothetical protein
MKRRIVFEIPVTFTADDEKALKEAIKDYMDNPAYESWCSAGYYWKSGKPRLPAARMSPDSHSVK